MMLTPVQFKEESLEKKISLLQDCFAVLSKHYDYFKELYDYLLQNSASISEEFLNTSYDIVYKLHEKLQK